jgi:allantoate deiminase
MLGIALVEILQEKSQGLPYGFEVVGFADEEGVRFRQPYLGSIGYIEGLRPGLLELKDQNGVSLESALEKFGVHMRQTPRPSIEPERLHSFFEMHIEQGPVLEAKDLSVGIVTAIVGQKWYSCSFEGQANHAGTTPMELRRDALAGAAELILYLEHMARTTTDCVATVGFTLDLRHPDDDRLTQIEAEVIAKAQSIASRRGLTFNAELRSAMPAAPCNEGLMRKMEQAFMKASRTPFRLLSGAGHDARVMALHAPMSMLFIRSPRGLSHHPEESVRLEDVAIALEVAYHYLLQL